MTIEILKKANYQKSLWKNGQGQTEQIQIFPEKTCLQKNDFHYRLSSATINAENTFSLFPDSDRCLIIWKGEGLLLNQLPLPPLTPFMFSGDKTIQCNPIGDKMVIDVGLIYKREHFRATLEVINQKPATLPEGIHFFFLAKGQNCFIGSRLLEEGDTVKIKGNEFLDLTYQGEITLFHFSLSKI